MNKRHFAAQFKQESIQWIVVQNSTAAEATKAMDVALSTITCQVWQLQD